MTIFKINVIAGFSDAPYASDIFDDFALISLCDAKTKDIKLLKKFMKKYVIRTKVDKALEFYLFDVEYTDESFNIYDNSVTVRISVGSGAYFNYHNGMTMEEYMTEVGERFCNYLHKKAGM